MRYFHYILTLFLITSCSQRIKVFRYESLDYGGELDYSLAKFKTNQTKVCILDNKRKYRKEFKRIKKYVLERNVDEFLNNSIYHFAYVLKKDTLYTTVIYSEDPEVRRLLDVWKYRGKTYLWESKIFHDSVVEFQN